MKKVAFYTLGCKLNFSETSTISRQFEDKGFKKVEFQDSPDIFIINTCSVTENADKKCKKIVKEAKKISPNSYVAIIGCYAQLKPREISEIKGVDAVLGAAEKFRLIELLGDFAKEQEAKVLASEITEAKSFNNAYSINDRTRTFLKVQDGCNYGCAFCTIPLARGKSRSNTIASVLEAAGEIATTDVKEVVLTGVNIGDFGIVDGKRNERFGDLVEALDEVEGIDRFRISSIEPNLLTNEIISFVSKSKRFVPHFHIPLQSGSNTILRSMGRRYLRELYEDRVSKIKSLMPQACIGVDVIVGFPGETDELFLETYNFLNELDISYLHVFTYSERANTRAAEMDGVVPMKKRNERSKMLRILSEKKRRKFYEENLGKSYTVLFEEDIVDGKMHGFTENYIRIAAKYDPMLINETKLVTLDHINESGNVEVLEPEFVYEKH
ncbi:MAG TPA: tRNA (N(6)-L-threonylcarbamoyladenosine(37)-C(2))-methylthiotransferase MtaB [Algoriphagus sp.]|uniref:tRNA (N(6)-L-threonylcarbamoyladenosine(37)-C(2))- methylthiotransferase MtaB n=1 Tax=unclassified Algoriphagus TaxID=2641541 RepID=UPI000C48FB83|nr:MULTISPECIES: tRNA (N(6)-L-threonylcarbamoyladenosine(37)-C(2))-methylthiotransferase MtaB [unclassified Algoriphagus]MAL13951.1 tRNA (N(6)-L-threonylcarbamoyladenosine(37)-C(2))-methylthiotransferase MtaB [Algoriphagus sp.]QYH38095.1 tRNA (N(6)-L-threonylcarbamoyladenosine(37)-C(2))-methylthiotransferase MtaB [Algoriphagus sp. NBT04N3]HAH38830.1 tRNA (N(6)-L-threonylcarbamoyladenosine(37)-C(2))-methylthiotransferase MtaB [Algoriphagus sp.]HAS59043.1 tRNA (N(6)-L-threonylcarbamoyladenosine(3